MDAHASLFRFHPSPNLSPHLPQWLDGVLPLAGTALTSPSTTKQVLEDITAMAACRPTQP